MSAHIFHLFFLALVFKIEGSTSLRQNCNWDPFQLRSTDRCDINQYCFTLDPLRLHTTGFSTKTAYRTGNFTENDFDSKNCEPYKAWVLIRHGTRLPNTKAIKRFRKMEKFRDEMAKNIDSCSENRSLCGHDWNMLKRWQWDNNITDDKAMLLVDQGYRELRLLARNFKRHWPKLFSGAHNINKFYFRHTNTERTRSSFQAFVNELFGENAHTHIDAEMATSQPNLLLKAYAHCVHWRERKRRLKLLDSEAMKFEETVVFRQLIANVDSKIGFDGNLTVDDIKNIYDLCRYEQAWNSQLPSAWCSLLTSSEVRVMEYQEDLKYFYKSSYGSPFNPNIMCFTMNDMLKRLSDESAATTVYFTHSSAVQLFLSSLGALKDTNDLRADNFLKMSNRKWQTSKISPFAANVAVVRYRCQTDDVVKFFLNEKPIYFDWCSSNGDCDWLTVQRKYEFYANANCDQVYCRKK